jgi:hypothetical protein
MKWDAAFTKPRKHPSRANRKSAVWQNRPRKVPCPPDATLHAQLRNTAPHAHDYSQPTSQPPLTIDLHYKPSQRACPCTRRAQRQTANATIMPHQPVNLVESLSQGRRQICSSKRHSHFRRVNVFQGCGLKVRITDVAQQDPHEEIGTNKRKRMNEAGACRKLCAASRYSSGACVGVRQHNHTDIQGATQGRNIVVSSPMVVAHNRMLLCK